MPLSATPHGSSDAIAVEATVGHELNSAYTFLLDHIVLLVWSLSVISGLLVYIKVYKARHPHDPFSRSLWARRSSPYSILKLTVKHLWKSKSRDWWVLLWVLLALGFLVMKYTIPIIFAPFIIIDNAAPVAAQAIYVPSSNNTDTLNEATKLLEYYALGFPAAFRAVGNIDTVKNTLPSTSLITVDRPKILPPNSSTNDPNQQISYRYIVTGLDFGLQNYPDLKLNVEGSCRTEYSWYRGSFIGLDTYVTQDGYQLYNDGSQSSMVYVNTNDSPAPVAQFFVNLVKSSGPASNLTWAAVISSVNRTSLWPSEDPWYKTGYADTDTDQGLVTYHVKPGRPALSCWQNDVWSYHGFNSSIINLTTAALPGLELPLALQDIFAHYLGAPKIPSLGSQLGLSALQSASTSIETVFNASSSSLYNDLERLVFASYIATVNTLTETTLYNTGHSIPNDILANGQIPDGVDEFVIWSKDVITLSVKALIIIPVLTAVLWIIFVIVLLLPLKPIQALKELAAHKASTYEVASHEEPTDEIGGPETPVVDTTAHRIDLQEAEDQDKEERKPDIFEKIVATAKSIRDSVDGNNGANDDAHDFV